MAARAAFLRDGYAAMSMSGLLDTLGGSKSTLWGYFPSKQDLFAAVLEEAITTPHAELATVFRDNRGLEEGIHAFTHSFLEVIEQPDALAVYRLIVAEGARHPELGQMFHDRVAAYPERLLAAFLQGFRGTALRDEEPQQMAAILIGLCTHHMHRLLFGLAEGSQRHRAATARGFAEIFLRAVRLPSVAG